MEKYLRKNCSRTPGTQSYGEPWTPTPYSRPHEDDSGDADGDDAGFTMLESSASVLITYHHRAVTPAQS